MYEDLNVYVCVYSTHGYVSVYITFLYLKDGNYDVDCLSYAYDGKVYNIYLNLYISSYSSAKTLFKIMYYRLVSFRIMRVLYTPVECL